MQQILEDYFKNDDFSVRYYDVIDSTNDEAKRIYAEAGDSDESYLLVAACQTKGRGRNGHSFYSPSNSGVYHSFLIPTDREIKDIVYMTTAAAVGVATAMRDVLKVDAGIKWINDIYIGGKKACGILCEIAENGSGKHGLIIGIGINIGEMNFPDEIKDIAVSVGSISDAKKAELLHEIARHIKEYLVDNNKAEMINDYRKLSLVIGKEITYTMSGVVHTAKAVGIDNEGGLIVDGDEGEKVLNSGEISVRLR